MANKIYEDREGNEIGTMEYINGSYLDFMSHIYFCISEFHDGKPFDVKIVNDKLNIYLAVRYCYDGDTSSVDNLINETMKEVPDFAKHIGYKPIK